VTALLDVNVLTALLWPAHEHHESAHRWFRARRPGRWATTPLTQLGFVRLVSNPAFSRDALSPKGAMALLAQNLAAPGHRFWTDGLQVPAALRSVSGALQGHQQLTDAYLVAVAAKRAGVVATFDRGLGVIAPRGGVVEVIPIR
jgi:toxin-antitoxin system PIN domain toxin